MAIIIEEEWKGSHLVGVILQFFSLVLSLAGFLYTLLLPFTVISLEDSSWCVKMYFPLSIDCRVAITAYWLQANYIFLYIYSYIWMKDIFVLYGSLFKCIYKRQICKQNIIHANEINFLRTKTQVHGSEMTERENSWIPPFRNSFCIMLLMFIERPTYCLNRSHYLCGRLKSFGSCWCRFYLNVSIKNV